MATGYLHNHARMWFASIWIFTLKLPWELGAAFFYEHLLDGEQRERLRARLVACSCWPAPADQVYWYSARWIG